MIQSMTGFGRAQAELAGLTLALELHAVNRRNFEASFALPREWQALEPEILGVLRQSFHRGKFHIALQVSMEGSAGGFTWDEAALDASLKRLAEAARRNGLSWEPDSDAVVRLAVLHKVEANLPEAGDVVDGVRELVGSAARGLQAMRLKEGQALASDLSQRLDGLERALKAIIAVSSETVPRYRELLFARLAHAGLELDLSDERVLKEIALFADRCDTSEEQTRIDSHLEQFRACLDEGSPVGRKLEFILQEINREFNTVGSKANDIRISREVFEAKNEIERIREQIQNIE